MVGLDPTWLHGRFRLSQDTLFTQLFPSELYPGSKVGVSAVSPMAPQTASAKSFSERWPRTGHM